MWTFIAYQESCDFETLKAVLEQYPVAISPLHDSDVDNAGNTKKAHWHIVTQHKFGAKEKRDVFQAIGMNGNCPLIKVRNNEGIMLYLTHESKTSGGKHVYDKEDIYKTGTWAEEMGGRNFVAEGYHIVTEELQPITYDNFVKYLFENADEELLMFCFKYDLKFKNLIDSLNKGSDQRYLDKIDKQRKEIERLELQIAYLTWDCPFAE